MSDNKKKDNKPKKLVVNSYWIYGIAIFVFIGLNILAIVNNKTEKTSKDGIKKMALANDIDKAIIVNRSRMDIYLTEKALEKEKYANFKKNKFGNKQAHYTYEIASIDNFTRFIDSEINRNKDKPLLDYSTESQPDYFGAILSWMIPILLILAIWIFFIRKMGAGGGGPGSQIFNIGKSKATLFDNNAKVNVTFKDVAGLEEAKEEVMEVVDFLKNPKKYTSLGGKIPKGVLLVGPPGTGKTLLAKAVAGEANVPFFSISGSDFVEMFVGVGASRVRDLFKQAREKAPCIIFIDEIDAIGRARGRGQVQGGNDERENTLNQLLVEMDGFSTDKGVILMAATNRHDILDNALMRPGRFDRQIGIDSPDLQGREAIFKVHLKNIKISNDVNPESLAEMTPGFAGAEIANVCNEAALVAARRNKKAVEMDDFNYALDRVIGGLEKKNKIISPREKEIIAYHEAGHAICGWFLENASPLVKVTIVPRGIGTLGYAQYLPKEEYITRTEALLDRMTMTLGGRAAEKIIFDNVSTGAQNDLDQVTKMAYSMITVFGMNDKVGNVSFYGLSQDQFNKPFSDDTATLIDEEVRKLIDNQYIAAQELLKDKRKELDIIAQQLLEKEVLHKSDIIRLIGERPYTEDSIFKPQNSMNQNSNGKFNELFEEDEVKEA